MSVDQDFDLVPDASHSAEKSAPAPPPLVVIQYRTRVIHPVLVPPLLILLIAAVIMSYQRRTPVRPIADSEPRTVEHPVTPRSPSPERPSQTSPRVIAVASRSYEPIVLRENALPSPESTKNEAPVPTAAKAASPAPIPPPAPTEATRAQAKTEDPPRPQRGDSFDLDGPRDPIEAANDTALSDGAPRPETAIVHRPAIGFTPPAESEPAVPEPAAEPKATKEDVEEQIRLEAEQKQHERKDLENLKPRIRIIEIADAIRRAQNDRAAFHDELRQVLRTPGRAAGPRIDGLCDVFGRDTHPAIRHYVSVKLKRVPPRASRQDIVNMMRQNGLPEPMILDYLSHAVEKYSLNARGGARNLDEVRIMAARQLLAIPLTRQDTAQPDRSAQAIVRTYGNAPEAPAPGTGARP